MLKARSSQGFTIAALTLAGALAAAMSVSPSVGAAPRGAPENASRAATGGILLGAASRPNQRGENFVEELSQLERMSGRTFALHRTYLRWDDSPITNTIRWDLATGHLPVVSIATRRGHHAVRWATIASGAEDRTIIRQAAAFKALGKPVVLGLHHEPEDDTSRSGSASDYAAAFRHYVNVFRAQRATNVEFAWIMMASSFNRGASRAAPFYPGDAYVDWIAADGYNWGVCRRDGWRSFAQVFNGFRSFAARHAGKPLMIAEFGSEEDPQHPGRKAQWFRDAITTLHGWPQMKAVAYFNTLMGRDPCRWPVNTSTTSLAGWRDLALDPHLQARHSG